MLSLNNLRSVIVNSARANLIFCSGVSSPSFLMRPAEAFAARTRSARATLKLLRFWPPPEQACEPPVNGFILLSSPSARPVAPNASADAITIRFLSDTFERDMVGFFKVCTAFKKTVLMRIRNSSAHPMWLHPKNGRPQAPDRTRWEDYPSGDRLRFIVRCRKRSPTEALRLAH